MKFSAVATLFLASAQASPLRRRLQATYKPGDFSDEVVIEDAERGTKMTLSNGLTGVVIAYNGEALLDKDGADLGLYHEAADGGAVIAKADGGYYYVSNCEQGEYPADFDIAMDDTDPTYREQFSAELNGGAYSLEFTADHELIGYKQILKNTAGNCAGGVTPWGTWVSCEERREFGQCWQADPTGETEGKPTDVTGPRGIPEYGYFEAFAWDAARNVAYVTDDDWQKEPELPAFRGALVRYTPDKAAMACLDADDKWCALESGSHAYLKLDTCNPGSFEWVADIESANPELYGGSEGMHLEGDILSIVTVMNKELFQFNLTNYTYTQQPVPFEQEPDNMAGLGDTLYICTDGDENPNDGIWAVDTQGTYQLFKEEGHNYPAGVAFTPDKKRMIFSMWGEATWMIWREDGMAFDEENAGAVYTESTTTAAVAVSKGGERA